MTARTIAITGGARGIGRATAHELLRRGHRVVVGDLDPAAAGPGLDARPLDVTDEGSFAAFLDGAGPLDVLVNNAGIAVVVPFADQTAVQQRREVAVNLGGVLTGTRLALRRGVPHVVNVASSAGRFATPGIATYSATKHAVVGLTEALRAEVPGTTFTAVLPGPVETEMIAGTRPSRFVRVVAPEDVARGIADAIERPRAEVWVPRELGVLQRIMAPLPVQARQWLARRLEADRIYTEVDHARRAGYDARTTGR
jgi:NAD(P)-dependent dehydrogenase (short-subunit alcohol dehydrogenase family)